MANSLLATFLAAGQASSSVLLVAFYGILAAELNILDAPATKRISALCVRILLPALLLTRIGSELEYGTWTNYIPVFTWAIFYNVASLLIGLATVRLLGWPRWLPVAATFNNTTSLPLLLLRAFESTGVLRRLLMHNESTAAAITRAQSYFLACSIIGNCLTFAVGPHLMRTPNPSATSAYKGKDSRDVDSTAASPMLEGSNERTSLLPHSELDQPALSETHDQPSTTKARLLSLLRDIMNEPTIGALLGLFIGVVPPLHRAFFNPTTTGGIFTPWLTASLTNIGQAFVPLQVFVVGVTLSQSFHQGHFTPTSTTSQTAHAHRPATLLPTLFILLIRFLLWPLISIPLIYLLATCTDLLPADPVLWFCMMLMPAGPPAMKLIAMADVGGADEASKISVARVLAVSYVCVPLLSFSVVAALGAVERAMREIGLNKPSAW